MKPRLGAAVIATLGLIAVSGCGSGTASTTAASTSVEGSLQLTAGHCDGGKGLPTGSYFVLVSAATGKLVANPDGGCANPSYTLLKPGRQGGITLGRFQPEPTPTFDKHGDARADDITTAVDFDGHALGIATASRDEQDAPSGQPAFDAPTATVQGNKLYVDLRSLVITYEGAPNTTCAQDEGAGCWNLGSKSAAGSYDAATGDFTLSWFTGEAFSSKGDSVEVHLAGHLVKSSAA